LVTCADIIRGNPTLQEGFAQLQVPSPLDPGADGDAPNANGARKVYVIDGLLDLTLSLSSLQAFELRLAACECLKAYFYSHAEVRLHFLKRAIEGHNAGIDETANVLTVLLRPSVETSANDPYHIWFAAIITFHLLFEDPKAKAMAMAVTEGDAASGEEVVTSIQTITAHVIAGFNRVDDSRILIGYLIILLGWLFEDLDAVDDFLSEGTNIQSLIQVIVQPRSTDEIVQGLSAMVLGVAYEFSTKDSPIPRTALHSILTSRMGRERYLDKLVKLRSHPFMRDFEVMSRKLDASAAQLPDVYFDGAFVDFFKDNYSRLTRSMDREPGIEISVVTNGVQKGISRELVDSLRTQVDERLQALQDAESRLSTLGRQLDRETAEHRRTRDSSIIELARIKSANETLHRQHDEELR
jgi:intracellular protein transport protein USO1